MKKCVTLPYFNSIKVRLILSSLLICLLFFLFQFHKGTIDTEKISPSTFNVDYYFNSIKVRLIPIESNGINTTKHNELGSTKMQKILEINVDAQLYF